jgi:endonuclease/exonuclease/phosphatase family metal-dependent hydrolase
VKLTTLCLAAATLFAAWPQITPGADAAGSTTNASSRQLTVMSFNIWGGGLNEGKPLTDTIAAIRLVNPDIVGLQETRAEPEHCTAQVCPPAGPAVTRDLATALGYFYYDQKRVSEANWSNAILSRYPILEATPNDLGVAIDVAGTTVYAFNIHLADYPYAPYQLLGIEYGDAPFLDTAEEAIRSAKKAHRRGLSTLFRDLATAPPDAVRLVFGDFNQPSHRDWTERTVATGRHPLAVRFPSVLAIEGRGFTDALRWISPDEVARPAYTWAPRAMPADPQEHHDRIDYVLVGGPNVRIEDAAIVGESTATADIVVVPWPSDHRAVAVKLTLNPGK